MWHKSSSLYCSCPMDLRGKIHIPFIQASIKQYTAILFILSLYIILTVDIFYTYLIESCQRIILKAYRDTNELYYLRYLSEGNMIVSAYRCYGLFLFTESRLGPLTLKWCAQSKN